MDFSSISIALLLMTLVINFGSYQVHKKYNSSIQELEDFNSKLDKIAEHNHLQSVSTINDFSIKKR